MPLPLFLAIAASMAAAGGIGTGVHGAVKMKGASDTVKAAGERRNENIRRFESCNGRTAGSMDKLGNLELDILASFEQFSDILEQIQNRPSFREFACDSVPCPATTKRSFPEFPWEQAFCWAALGARLWELRGALRRQEQFETYLKARKKV